MSPATITPPADAVVQTTERLRFGKFEVDARTGELWKNGRRVHLQERPFQMLAVLVTFHWLDQAMTAREWQAATLAVDPLYDSLRPDPRFNALVARIGVPR
jgi:hypothetical protein